MPAPSADPSHLAEARRKARLRELIQHEGSGGAASIARKAGRSQGGISHMSLPGYHFKERAARELERDLGLPHGYFDMPEAPAGTSQAVRLVPVMEWGRVGRHPPGPDTPTVATALSVGPRAVAAVAKAMMWSGDGLGVPAGWHMIIDPDVVPTEGDLVLCWLPGATEACLRQFVLDGGVPYLYPVDRRQSSVSEWNKATLVIGPLVAAGKTFR